MRRFLLLPVLALAVLAAALVPGPGPAAANPLSGIAAVAAGGTHTCALTAGGGVKCWGNNLFGEAGDGTNLNIRPVPVDVVGLQDGVTAIATGGGLSGLNHTCALTDEGGVKCWGYNGYGQLGFDRSARSCPEPKVFPVSPAETQSGTAPCSTVPVDVPGLEGVTAIDAGHFHTCAITNTGGVKCWGENIVGQLGDGGVCGDICDEPVDVTGLTSGIVAIALAADHTCAVTDAGGVQCWGSNVSGKLGAPAGELCRDAFGILVPCSTTPVDVCQAIDEAGEQCDGFLSGVTGITTGIASTCVLTNAGGVKCWGVNESGELGDGTRTARTTPVDVVGLDAAIEALAPNNGFGSHTCALSTNANVKCWGFNYRGQLGSVTTEICQGTTTCSPFPLDVLAHPEGPPLGGVVAVTTGTLHTCAVTVDGRAQCWGSNCCGQLGQGGSDFDAHYVPRDVVALESKKVAGDSDCSGDVTSVDAAVILQFDAGLTPALPCPHVADVNGDDRWDALDAALILQRVAGIIDSL